MKHVVILISSKLNQQTRNYWNCIMQIFISFMKCTCIRSLAHCRDEIICFKKQRTFLMTRILFREDHSRPLLRSAKSGPLEGGEFCSGTHIIWSYNSFNLCRANLFFCCTYSKPHGPEGWTCKLSVLVNLQIIFI